MLALSLSMIAGMMTTSLNQFLLVKIDENDDNGLVLFLLSRSWELVEILVSATDNQENSLSTSGCDKRPGKRFKIGT